MKPFTLSVENLLLPYADNIDFLLYEPINATILDREVPAWQVFIYECIVKSKTLINNIVDSTVPIVWLLPAWVYQPDRIKLLTTSLQEQYNERAQHLIFNGSSSIDSAIALASEKNWPQVHLIALDATYRVDKNGRYLYQGTGGALATLSFVQVGWAQSFSELVPSINFVQNNVLNGMLTRASQTTTEPFDIIFTPGNGVEAESDVWLQSLQAINDKITEKTMYRFPQYTYGKVGALSGLINLYTLTTNPTLVSYTESEHEDADFKGCALIISQEKYNHQAVASYLWIGKESNSNG